MPAASDSAADTTAGVGSLVVTREAIDWLAEAPWLRLVAVPRLALSPAILLFAYLLAGETGIASDVTAPAGWTEAPRRAAEGLAAPWVALMSAFRPESIADVGYAALGFVFAGVLLSWVASWVTPSFTGQRPGPTLAIADPSIAAWSVASLLLAAPGLALLGVVAASVTLVPTDFLEAGGLVVVMVWPMLIALGTLAGVLLTIAVLGIPFAVVASVVERADAFDAASRGFAYVTQRPLVLLWSVAVAATLGVASVTILELLLAAGADVARRVAAPLLSDTIDTLLSIVAGLGRAYATAYTLVAICVIYLVQRQAVDGQLIDDPGPTRFAAVGARGEDPKTDPANDAA